MASHLARRPVSARPAMLGYRASLLVRRYEAALAGAALAVRGLGSATALGMWATGRSSSQPAAITDPTRSGEAAQSAEQLRVVLLRVSTLAAQG
jgi:hypothetical protein